MHDDASVSAKYFPPRHHRWVTFIFTSGVQEEDAVKTARAL
jgi:hypothetical protein